MYVQKRRESAGYPSIHIRSMQVNPNTRTAGSMDSTRPFGKNISTSEFRRFSCAKAYREDEVTSTEHKYGSDNLPVLDADSEAHGNDVRRADDDSDDD